MLPLKTFVLDHQGSSNAPEGRLSALNRYDESPASVKHLPVRRADGVIPICTGIVAGRAKTNPSFQPLPDPPDDRPYPLAG